MADCSSFEGIAEQLLFVDWLRLECRGIVPCRDDQEEADARNPFEPSVPSGVECCHSRFAGAWGCGLYLRTCFERD